MLRYLVTIAVAISGLELAVPHLAAAAESNDVKMVAARTYTVWYQKGNSRWTGISGLSYYHACQVRDDYINRGYRAYIAAD